jgi:hypothetical protein
MKKAFIHVREIPSSEEDPFQLFLRCVDKDGMKKDELNFYDTSGSAVKRLVIDVPITNNNTIELKLSIPKARIYLVRSFNIIDDGEHILFTVTNGVLKIVQEKDDCFEGSVPLTIYNEISSTASIPNTQQIKERKFSMDDLVNLDELVQKGILSEEEYANWACMGLL